MLIKVGVAAAAAATGRVFVGGILGITFYQVGSSEAAAKAKDFLRNNDKLAGDIGEVKDFGRILSGGVIVVNNNGEATLHIKVIGERQSVDTCVNLVFTNGSAWRVSAASYVDSSGQKIYLPDPYDSKNLVPHLIA